MIRPTVLIEFLELQGKLTHTCRFLQGPGYGMTLLRNSVLSVLFIIFIYWAICYSTFHTYCFTFGQWHKDIIFRPERTFNRGRKTTANKKEKEKKKNTKFMVSSVMIGSSPCTSCMYCSLHCLRHPLLISSRPSSSEQHDMSTK
jgi:hypothetical protein